MKQLKQCVVDKVIWSVTVKADGMHSRQRRNSTNVKNRFTAFHFHLPKTNFKFHKAVWKPYSGEMEKCIAYYNCGKIYPYYAPNFCQNLGSFTEDMTKTRWLTFLLRHGIGIFAKHDF